MSDNENRTVNLRGYVSKDTATLFSSVVALKNARGTGRWTNSRALEEAALLWLAQPEQQEIIKLHGLTPPPPSPPPPA